VGEGEGEEWEGTERRAKKWYLSLRGGKEWNESGRKKLPTKRPGLKGDELFCINQSSNLGQNGRIKGFYSKLQ